MADNLVYCEIWIPVINVQLMSRYHRPTIILYKNNYETLPCLLSLGKVGSMFLTLDRCRGSIPLCACDCSTPLLVALVELGVDDPEDIFG